MSEDLGTMIASLPVRQDPWYIICERAMEDKRYARVRDQILRGARTMAEGIGYFNMDGEILFHNTRVQSVISAAATSVTGATTDKLLHKADLITLPQGYFKAGKKLRMTLEVAVTSGTTPGNSQIDIYVGSTDAGGTLIVSSAAFATIATQTSLVHIITAYLVTRSGVEETVPVEAYGTFVCPTAITTAANQQAANPIPVGAPANVNIDNTLTTLGFNIQMKNSGANANTYVTRDLTFEALT
jgi:hypothetical protein